MNDALAVDASALREEVKAKYRAVAVDKRRVFSEILRVLRPGGALAVCRHREWQADTGSGDPQHRPVDRLNRRRPAVRRLAADARAERFR